MSIVREFKEERGKRKEERHKALTFPLS